jgi:heme-degrading monooxygenase HmoA
MTTFHIAQINVGRILGPIDSAIMAEFVARLDEINALADGSPGFVWRLQTEDGDATAIRPFEDERIILTMSVWESPAALHAYVYQSAHAEVMRRRREWFSRMTDAFLALWWVPAGHVPTVAEAVARLDRLRADGPTPHAFTFRQQFPPPDAEGVRFESVELPGECPELR